MTERPPLDEVVSTPSFDRAATAVSKTYIVLFFAFCIIVAYLDQPALGWLWAVVLIGGLFASSVLIAAPVTGLKLLLATKVGISPVSTPGRVLYGVVDVAGYAVLWFATRYLINALSA